MSDDQNFLSRWSRRKRGAATDTDTVKPSKQIHVSDGVASEAVPASLGPGENGLAFDPASLPAIESIGAESNIRAFLEAGVPDDLARAALRRVWSLDPAIRDFVGLSENSWDFNTPGAMDGFGPIDGEQVRRILSRLLGEPSNNTASVHTPIIPPADDFTDSAGLSGPVERHATSAESVRPSLPKAQEPDLDEIDVADDVAHFDRDVAPKSEFSPSRGHSKDLRRAHGGALPQLRNMWTETDDYE